MKTYTTRSNARRAAKQAGVDPDLVMLGLEGGYSFPDPHPGRGITSPAPKKLDPVTAEVVSSFLADLKADPKKDGIPVELQVQNRKPPTPEQKAALAALMAEFKARPARQTPEDIEALNKIAELQKLKLRNRAERRKAKRNGETAKMPLEGKAALNLINHGTEQETDMAKKITKTNGKAKANGKSVKAKQAEGPRPGSKLALVVQLLTRAKGCTSAEVLAATGWPSVSMPQQAKAAGLKLIKDKVRGEVTRYRAG